MAVCPTVTVGGPDYRLLPSNAIIVNYLNDPFSLHLPRRVQRGPRGGRRHSATSWRPSKGARGERYLLGSDNLTWADIHQTIAELCGVRGPTMTATLTAAYLAASAMELAARWTQEAAGLHPGRGQGTRALLLVPQ